jgi:hypothetical protein
MPSGIADQLLDHPYMHLLGSKQLTSGLQIWWSSQVAFRFPELGQSVAAYLPSHFSVSISTSTNIERRVDTLSSLIGLEHAHLML